MAELERTWAITSAHADGRVNTEDRGCGRARPRRGYTRSSATRTSTVSSAVALGALRSLYGWPAPEDPDGGHDDELAGRELIAQRLGDEVEWLHECTNWLANLSSASTRR